MVTDLRTPGRVASPPAPVVGLRRCGVLVAVPVLWLSWVAPAAVAAGPRPATSCTGVGSLTDLGAKVGGATVAVRHRVVSGVVEGATVQMSFTVRDACGPVTLSLVAYQAPGPTFVRADAAKQRVSASVTKTLGPGPGSLSVAIPSCYFQVDLVVGAVRDRFGGPGSSTFYSREHRLVAHATGGTKACSTVQGVKITKPPVELPRTGAPVADHVLLGTLVALAGGLLCVAGRRSWFDRYGETF